MPCVPVGWARRRGLGLRPLGEQVFLDRTRHALAHEDSPRARCQDTCVLQLVRHLVHG